MAPRGHAEDGGWECKREMLKQIWHPESTKLLAQGSNSVKCLNMDMDGGLVSQWNTDDNVSAEFHVRVS